MTLAGLIVLQFNPAGTTSVKLTVPANPLRGVTLIVAVVLVLTGTGPAAVMARLKSVTVNVAVAV